MMIHDCCSNSLKKIINRTMNLDYIIHARISRTIKLLLYDVFVSINIHPVMVSTDIYHTNLKFIVYVTNIRS